jgi:cytoskeletal protein CcmA (bactofilin family)
MASTFTTLGIEKMATGENAGTWGDKTNTNLDIVNTVVSGYVEQAVTNGGTLALSITDGASTATAQNAVIKLTGTITGNSIVTVPDSVEKVYIVTNGTSGAYTVQFKTASGTGVTFGVSEKTTKLLYSDGTNIVDAGFSGALDIEGRELVLDADGDTTITADTDDQIDIKIAGADDFQFTANTFTAQAGSTIAAQALTATTVTASGIVKTDDTTEATSTTDGSLQTDGGLSVAKDAVFGDDVKLLSDSAVLSFGADSDTTLTHTDGTGLTLNSTNKLLFRDTGLYINSSTDGQLDIVADTEIQIAATTIDINGAIAMDGAITGATNITLSGELDAATLDISGNADIDGTLEADAITINGTAIGSIYGAVAGSSSIVTTGALDSGSITSGFGTIDTGSSTITTTGLISGGSLDIDDVLINGTTIGHTNDTDLITLADGVATVAGEISVTTLDIGGTNVTTTAAEINLIDGGTSRGTTAVADGDGILINDAGTMRMTTVQTVSTYMAAESVGGSNIVTTGALDSGSITSGFGAIDNGTSNIRSATITAETAFVPDASGGADLGTTALEFNDAFFNDGAVINFGDDQDTTLTHTDGTGLTLNSTNKLCFNDASQFIQGTSATVLSIGATDEIDLTATAVDLNGTLNVSGVATFQATPVFPDGSLALADLDIDGATDIGEAIVDADLFIIDNGAGGTNRKTAASRLVTYIDANSSAASVGKAIAMAIVFG